jgi:hypothetical protein
MPACDFLLHLTHQPCFAGLTGRPYREKMSAFIGFSDKLIRTSLNQFFTLNAIMFLRIHRSV